VEFPSLHTAPPALSMQVTSTVLSTSGLWTETTRRPLAPPAGARQRVELGLPIVVGHTPFRVEPSSGLEPVQGRIQRPLFDLEVASGDLLDAQQDAVPVLRAERDRLEDQQVERAGKNRSGHRSFS